MDNIGRLVDQVAAEAGCTATRAKLAIYLFQISGQGRTLKRAAELLKRKPNTVKLIAREFMIDFPDYRPFERDERAGRPRPDPKYPISLS